MGSVLGAKLPIAVLDSETCLWSQLERGREDLGLGFGSCSRPHCQRAVVCSSGRHSEGPCGSQAVWMGDLARTCSSRSLGLCNGLGT